MNTQPNLKSNARRRTCAHQWATAPQKNIHPMSRYLRVVATCIHCYTTREWTFHNRGYKGETK